MKGSITLTGMSFISPTHLRAPGRSARRQWLYYYRHGGGRQQRVFLLHRARCICFRASEVPYGKGIYKLGGRVYVDRVPVTARLTDTRKKRTIPSLAAGANGDIWLAYVQFHHSPDADKIRANPPEMPKDFKIYAEPTGGDQIWARKYSRAGTGAKNIAVTPAGGDCYKAAVAVDGSGRAWVVWSENHGGNFDIFARAVDASGAGEQVQISNEARRRYRCRCHHRCGRQGLDRLARLAQRRGGHLRRASGGQGLLQAGKGFQFEPRTNGTLPSLRTSRAA